MIFYRAGRGFVIRVLVASTWLAATTALAQVPISSPIPAPAAHPAIEPAALARLRATSQRLAEARSMSFTAVTTYESIATTGQSLFFSTESEVTVERPNKLRVLTPGDGPPSDFYYDGKTMVAFDPAANLVAIAPAPPTIPAMLAAAYAKAAIHFPFAPLLAPDPYANLSEGLSSAFFVGQSRVIDATLTDMIAFVNKRVQGEIWIGIDDGLPRKIQVTYLHDPARLHYSVELFDWRLNVKLTDADFDPAKIRHAGHMPFARPDAPASQRGSK